MPRPGREWTNTKVGRAGSVHYSRRLTTTTMCYSTESKSGCGEGLASVISPPVPNFPIEFVQAELESPRIWRSTQIYLLGDDNGEGSDGKEGGGTQYRGSTAASCCISLGRFRAFNHTQPHTARSCSCLSHLSGIPTSYVYTFRFLVLLAQLGNWWYGLIDIKVFVRSPRSVYGAGSREGGP